MSNYRCREHPDEPVTWRGTGCAQCKPPPVDEWRPTRRGRGFMDRVQRGEYDQAEDWRRG